MTKKRILILLVPLIALITGTAWWQARRTQVLPEEKNLAVPFTPQAPEGTWYEPWQNACEETSIIMIDNFYDQQKLNPEQAREEILKVFSLKNERFGKSLDESMELISDLVNDSNLGWKAEVKENPDLETIKSELAAGRPIIAPVYVPLLKSDAYGPDGPDYHVFVISGYDEDAGQFIVQDPGTSRGQNYRFDYEELLNAIHDYLPKNYQAGRKAVLFTRPN